MNLGRAVRDVQKEDLQLSVSCVKIVKDSGTEIKVRIYLSELLQHQWNSSYLHLACTLLFPL